MKTVTLLPGEVLVTGSSGLIGSALCAARHGDANAGLPNRQISLDVLSRAELLRLPFRPRAVVHLAGDGQPTTPWNEVSGMFRSTVETCVTVMDTLMPATFVFTSSCAVYGETPPEGARAQWGTPLPPSIYATCKRIAEMACQEWAQSSGKVAVILRLGNIVGTGARGLIEFLVRHAVRYPDGSHPARIRGNGRVLRDYVPVAHLIAIIRASLEREWEPGCAHVVNVGSGIGLTNGEVARAVGELLRQQGYVLHIECDSGLSPAEPLVSMLDVSDTTRRLGIPPPPLDAVWKGIEETVLDSLRRTAAAAQTPEAIRTSQKESLPVAGQDSAL